MSGETKKFEQNVRSELKVWEGRAASSLQTQVADMNRYLQGDFNNIGRNFGRNVLSGLTGGSMSQEDMQRITGETGSERFARETAEGEAAVQAADVAAREEERRQQIIRRISAEVENRRMTPGTSLLTTGALAQQSAGNTILTARR